MTKRIRQVLHGPLTEDELRRRQEEGWRPVAVEWECVEPAGGPDRPLLEEVPYGLKVAADHVHLEENPREVEAMMTILEGIVEDRPMSRIADELNRRGHAMRSGEPWTQSGVFELLPRLIEFGPRLFNREEWVERRRILRQKVAV